MYTIYNFFTLRYKKTVHIFKELRIKTVKKLDNNKVDIWIFFVSKSF